MAFIPILTVLEHSKVSPPPATVGHRSMPLTFFDRTWLLFPPVHYLFFYEFPHSRSHFIETVIPNLKHSLSITLQHFFPFVSNLIVFPNPSDSARKPEIRHVEGDFVAVTFAECNFDFGDLTGNHPRNCEKFYPLVPPLGHAVKEADYVTLPLFSVQMTFFRDGGISIGMTNHHSLGDATTRFCFVKAWTSIARSGRDDSFLANEPPPIFDRLVEISKLNLKVDTFYQPPCLVGPADKVRATFVLTRTNINQLKKRVQNEVPTLEHISSLTVTCGYIWSSVAKAQVKAGENTGEDELEQFILSVDCRSRLDPPLPMSYFGNCVAPCITTIRNAILSGENGFVVATKLIGEDISKMVNKKDGILKDAERWQDSFKIPAKRMGVNGTAKLNFYGTDFGWGKPKKYEAISNDYNRAISINACKESPQDLEIGVSLHGPQMEAFANIFHDGLQSEIPT